MQPTYAIATSGTGRRHGIKNGKPWHHIIDPRTLQPATTDVALATGASIAACFATTLPVAAIGSPDIIVPAAQGPSVTQQLTNRTQSTWPWYITRASGFVAAAALIILILSGVGFITGRSFAILEPLTAWATHRAIGIIFAISVSIHMLALLFDHFAPFTILQILLPFASNYHPVTLFGVNVGSLYVALGVIAFYLVAAIVISSLLWIDKKPRLWKLTHFTSYLVLIFVFIHALYLGTDLTSGALRVIWIIGGCIGGVAILIRLSRRARARR